MKRIVAILCGLVAVCCIGKSDTSDVVFKLRAIDTFDSQNWTGKVDPKDPVVATVEGTPITQSMLKRQLALSPSNSKPSEILDKMIEMELLAKAAFKSGKYTEQHIGQAMRKALAHRWLEDQMTDKLSPESVPDKYITMAYNQFRARYDHYERFVVIDVQVLCCDDVYVEGCFRDDFDTPKERKTHLRECLDYHKNDIQKFRNFLASAQTPEQLKTIYDAHSHYLPNEALRAQYNTSAKLSEYSFQYDVDVSFEKQFEKINYRMLFKEVMDGVRNAYFTANRTAPFVTEPIRSPIGWHIIFVHEVQPERHWKIDHPEVQKELRKAAFDPWRKVYFQERMDSLCKTVGCELNHERLVPLQQLDDKQ